MKTAPLATVLKKENVWSGFLFALVTIITIPVFWHVLPCSDDTLPHLYRAVQVDVQVQQGAPFLQWGSDLLRGYGYPIFAFYAPFSYVVLEILHLLGADFSLAMQIAFVLSLWLAGWGMFLFARQFMGRNGAFVAGLAYLFAPYLLYDAVQRGALPETLALAITPWALTAVIQALNHRTAKHTIIAAALYAILILTHNVIPFFALGLGGGFALVAINPRDIKGTMGQAMPAITALLLALGLTAFFWLPGLAELQYTQSRQPDPFYREWPRFEQHILPARSIAQWPDAPPDAHLINPPITRTIGLGQAALAAIGILTLPWASAVAMQRRRLWLLALLTIAALFFSSDLSLWWWHHVSLLSFIQLPTRFLGLASLGTALFAGVMVDTLQSYIRAKWGRWLLLTTAVFAVSLSGWAWLYPHRCAVPQQPDQLALAQATTWTRWYAEAQAELLPRWVKQMPPEDGLMAQYEAGGAVNRLELPETAVLQSWQSGAGWDEYNLHLNKPTELIYHSFYFPGWQAMANGNSLSITPTTPEGLISITLPAGEHALTFAFTRTPIRQVTLLVSSLTLLFMLIWGWRNRAQPPSAQPIGFIVDRENDTTSPIPLFLLALTLIIMKFGIIDHISTPIYADRMQDGTLSNIAHPANINFEGEFIHLGYDGVTEIAADEPFEITQYWSPQRNIGVPYRFALSIVDDEGRRWEQQPQRPFGFADFPGERGWIVGDYARDSYHFQLLPGTPPGTYWLESSIFRADTDQSLMPQNGETGDNPSHVRIGQLVVSAGDWNVDNWSADDRSTPADNAQVATFSPTEINDLTLLGWTVPNTIYRSGETAQLDLLWQNPSPNLPTRPLTTTLWLHDDDDNPITHRPLTIGDGIVRDQVQWRLPAELESGIYTIWLGADESAIKLGAWQVDAPPHNFTPPPLTLVNNPDDTALSTTFAELSGYNVESADGSIAITLVWHALTTADDSYRIFVHLRDADGNTIAQSDAIPDNWTRPTTGWVAGEYIRDKHTLTVPAGTYDIAIGWYDAATGARLDEAIIDNVNSQ